MTQPPPLQPSPLQPPPNWGNDELSRFIGLALNNSFAAFVHYEDVYSALRAIDGWFVNINSFHVDNYSAAEGMLLASASSNFRASVSLALSGQGQAAHCLFRVIMECGLYALHINKNKGLGAKWLKKHKSKAELTEIEREFSYRNLSSTLRKQSEDVTDSLDRLYRWCNDFGAHPNERSINASMEAVEVNNSMQYRYNYLPVDEENMKSTLQTCAKIGLGALYLFQFVFTDRYNMLGLSADMDQLRKRL